MEAYFFLQNMKHLNSSQLMWVGYTCDWFGFEISQLNKIEFSLKNPPLQLMCSPTSNFDGLLFLYIHSY